MDKNRPQVGVGLIIIKGKKVLLGKRRGSHGHGEYASTGGHLENGETLEECVMRELREEAGPDIQIKNLRFVRLINLRKYAPKHYIDIGFIAEWKSGEPKVMESNKKESWDWYDMDNLPSPLFGTVEAYIDAYKTGQILFEN
jgi:8-oxo-dGTP diphosphatase